MNCSGALIDDLEREHLGRCRDDAPAANARRRIGGTDEEALMEVTGSSARPASPCSAFRRLSPRTGVDFYKGKTVTYIVATAPGGGYDSYGRLVAEYMQRYLPGSTFVVKNMPGAGHLIGTNAIYASKPTA